MEIFQIIISSIFSIIGAASILFIAARAYSIGSDVSEIKELLKEIRRDSQNRADFGLSESSPGNSLEPGNWPSVTDPRYNADQERLPYALRTPTDTEEAETPTRKPAGW